MDDFLENHFLTSKFQHLYLTWIIFTFEITFSKILSEIASENLWDEMFTPKINSRITAESNIITLCQLGALITFLLFSMECLPIFNFFQNIFDALNSLKDIFGPISNVVNLAVYLTFPVVGYSACCGGGLMIYMVLHIKFHVYCISHRLEELSTRKVCDYSKMDEFHMEVRSDLKTCIRCHQVIQM